MSLTMLRKPNSRRKGLKILVYGPTGVGKTLFGLSFPKVVAMDTEDGYSWYEGTDKATNLIGVLDSQSFDDLANLLDELNDSHDEVGTFVIDSETKIYENIQQALQEIEEKRALHKGRDVLDANLSVRSWGKIKQLAAQLQNSKLLLASRGVNIVSVAQSSDIMKDAGGNTRIKVGEKPDMAKKAPFDYDVILRLFVRDDKYYGVVEKDRTGTYKLGTEIENPSYDNWAKRLSAADNQGDVIIKDFSKDAEKSKVAYEESVVAELPFKERVEEYLKSLDGRDEKEAFAKEVKELTGSASLGSLTKEQQAKVIDYINKRELPTAA